MLFPIYIIDIKCAHEKKNPVKTTSPSYDGSRSSPSPSPLAPGSPVTAVHSPAPSSPRRRLAASLHSILSPFPIFPHSPNPCGCQILPHLAAAMPKPNPPLSRTTYTMDVSDETTPVTNPAEGAFPSFNRCMRVEHNIYNMMRRRYKEHRWVCWFSLLKSIRFVFGGGTLGAFFFVEIGCNFTCATVYLMHLYQPSAIPE